ncbi:MAG: acetoin dehydrogenase dihydrolipoyllysine-residue acetyltransferase subunit [Alphaproteobacteria bacterium]|nr:acetoin dehydrogenase dihydrolipoyllysine-residue acetyltransferase subunit [Alphaproteobacteria bacterium]
MNPSIRAVTVPKWGMAMSEGKVTRWLVAEGAAVGPGVEIVDVESTKIASAIEAPVVGVLRRRVATEGATLPVGGLLGVIADASVADADLDAFVAGFKVEAVAADDGAGAPAPTYVEVGGNRLRYLAMGDGGIPVVLIHGFGGDLENWLFNQPALAASRRAIALDLPGHGGSSKAVGAGDVATLAAAVAGLLVALDVGKAHLVGHSLGGAVAARVAIDHPEAAAALSLIASAGLGPEIDGAYLQEFIAAGRRRELGAALGKLFADPALVTGDMINNVLKSKRLDGATEALTAIAVGSFPGGRQAWVMRDRLAGLTIPVQAIFGAEDRIIPTAHAAGLPSHIIAGAGHMVHMEKAAEVNRLIGGLV